MLNVQRNRYELICRSTFIFILKVIRFYKYVKISLTVNSGENILFSAYTVSGGIVRTLLTN